MDWEIVEENFNDTTNQTLIIERVGIPSGWLVRSLILDAFGAIISSSITSVPDLSHKWKVK